MFLSIITLISVLVLITLTFNSIKEILSPSSAKNNVSKVQVTKGAWPKVKLACKLFWKPFLLSLALLGLLISAIVKIKSMLGL